MFELTAENALDYLRRTGRLPDNDAHVEVLSGGVSNMVLRVSTLVGQDSVPVRIVLKQSRPKLRTRDDWFSDLERVYREQEVMEALEPHLPEGVVPQVLFADRPNFVFAMSHAPDDARVWKSLLLDGHIDLGFGESVGTILGLMHEASARYAANFARFRDSTVFVQLRVDPFYRSIQKRLPEIAVPVQDLVDQMLTRHEALCHGDYTPKNMLIHGCGFMLVDYETAYFGDPAMDLGLYLAHLFLKWVRRPKERFGALIQSFWRGYSVPITFRSTAELETRGVRHLGACLLARIDGTSPVDYLSEESKREHVRRLGKRILLEKWNRLDDVISFLENETSK
ncbi:MAG: phosphotransferase [Gemmataceae bacterium]|nr:phosphotransferase [Gemmataceae bacterium]